MMSKSGTITVWAQAFEIWTEWCTSLKQIKKKKKKSEKSVYDIPIPLSAIYRYFHHKTTNDVSIWDVVVSSSIFDSPITRSVSIRAYPQYIQHMNEWARTSEILTTERVHVMLLIYLKWTRNRIMLQLLQINESHSNLQVDVIVCTSIRYLRCDSQSSLIDSFTSILMPSIIFDRSIYRTNQSSFML